MLNRELSIKGKAARLLVVATMTIGMSLASGGQLVALAEESTDTVGVEVVPSVSVQTFAQTFTNLHTAEVAAACFGAQPTDEITQTMIDDTTIWNLSYNELTDISGIEVFSNLERLSLSNNNLTSLPDSIGDLSNLEWLYLYDNELTSLPDSICNLSNLTDLVLSNNSLTSLPESIGNLSNLQALYMHNNSVTSLPGSIGDLSNLQSLEIFENSLTSLPESFGNLSSLKYLSLYDNGLTSLPDSFGNLSNLQVLYLSINSLTSLPDSFGDLFNLQLLYLSNNSLTSLPDSFGDLANLGVLYLSNNSLTSLPDSFGDLANLQYADLSGNNLASLPDGFGDLSNLQAVDLSDNNLTSLPESIANLSSLQSLDLNNNNLTSLPESIGNFSSLQGLHLDNNNLTSLPDSFGNLSNRFVISLHNNELISITPEQYSKITSMTSVYGLRGQIYTRQESNGYIGKNYLLEILPIYGQIPSYGDDSTISYELVLPDGTVITQPTLVVSIVDGAITLDKSYFQQLGDYRFVARVTGGAFDHYDRGNIYYPLTTAPQTGSIETTAEDPSEDPYSVYTQEFTIKAAPVTNVLPATGDGNTLFILSMALIVSAGILFLVRKRAKKAFKL